MIQRMSLRSAVELVLVFGVEGDQPTWSNQLHDTGPKSKEANSFGYQFYPPAPPHFRTPVVPRRWLFNGPGKKISPRVATLDSSDLPLFTEDNSQGRVETCLGKHVELGAKRGRAITYTGVGKRGE